MFTAKINDKPVQNATCVNCKLPLEAWTVDTNRGKQAFYSCTNENCKLRNLVTVGYFPPAEGQPSA